MAAERRALPGLAEFAGLSWSAWLERAGPPPDTGSSSELEEGGKSSSSNPDTVTLIKEDMDIFGHCPAHDDFYLVVCNHCSQVVKPQAFQKHCERRHGPLPQLCARPPPCPGPLNGAPPGAAKAHPGARGRSQALPEHPDKDSNLCLFVPVVNLEKIPSIPKPDGHGIKVPPKGDSKESPVPKEPPVPAGGGGDSALPGDKDLGTPKAPPGAHRKLARKECDLNRQCGVRNPDTNTLCTRLLTCKIHSVHQRREVPGRAKDFDVLVAELKGSRRGDPLPKERSPSGKEPPPPPTPQDAPPAPPQPPRTPPCRAKLPLCPHPPPRARHCSDSDPEDAPAAPGEGGTGRAPPGTGGSRGASEDSEEERAGEEPRRTPRPPRPQAFCTFGSRLVTAGWYVFDRRLDRVCSALGSMLDGHRSAHRWRKIPPAAHPSPPHSAAPTPPTPLYGPAAPSPPPPRPLPAPGVGGRVPTSLTYSVGSPPAAAACSPPECGGGGSQSITSPLPAHTPSPSFSKLPPPKAPRDTDPRPWQPRPSAGSPPYKRTCVGDGVKGKNRGVAPPGKTKPTPSGDSPIALLNGTPRVRRPPPPQACRGPPNGARDPPLSPLAGLGGPPRGLEEAEVKKRKNSATYCRPNKPKSAPPLPGPPCPAPSGPATPGPGGSVRRKKPGTPPGFEEKRSVLKSKAH